MLALVMLVIGAMLRYHYFIIEQYLLKLLIGISVLILVCSALMVLLKTSAQTYRDSLILAVAVVILCNLTYESAAGNRRKNQQHLERIAGIVNRYTQKHHTAPHTVDDALRESCERLPNRGDADGNPYAYLRIGERIFILRSLGANQKNDAGSGDDVQLNYVNGNRVSFEELVREVQSHGTAEEKTLEAFWPALSATR